MMKTPQQQRLASTKYKTTLIDSNSNDESDKDNIKSLKADRLAEMHQVRFEGQRDNSDNFVIVDAVLENSEQYNLNLSSSADDLNNSLTPAQNT